MTQPCYLISIDNSDQTRNSDIQPSRLQQPINSARVLLCGILDYNPEAVCGILSMASQHPTVVSGPSRDSVKLLEGLT